MKLMTKTKKIVIMSLILSVSFFVILGLAGVLRTSETPNPSIVNLSDVNREGYYSEYLSNHQGLPEPSPVTYTAQAVDFVLPLGYEIDSNQLEYSWMDHHSILLNFDVDEAGLYEIHVRYLSLSDSHIPITLSVRLNGSMTYPFFEASQMTLHTLWKESSNVMGTDRYGNDVSVTQETYDIIQDVPLRDARRLYPEGLRFYLNAGINTIELIKLTGELRLSEVRLETQETLMSYSEYQESSSYTPMDDYIRIEAEDSFYKSSSTIARGISRDPLILPFSMTKLKLNVLGTDSYDTPGDFVTWKVDVERPGWYNLTLRAKQNRDNSTSYRTLYINGEIPFEEARHLAFSYDRNWQNMTLHTLTGVPIRLYLEPGDTLSLEVDGTLFNRVYEKLRIIASEMSALGLDITKLTRNNTDQGIDWEMLDYFPDLLITLETWVQELEQTNDVLRSLYGFQNDAQVVRDLEAAISKIEKIESDINELPRRLTLLSTGSSSAVQLITNQLDQLIKQPMMIDAIFIHTADHILPEPNPNLWTRLYVGIARFVLSFIDPSYTEKANPDELEIWVNRSRQYVDMMQKISDDQFTSETGIKVKISLINDDGKLLLANSANQQPDAALGVSAWIPNEYGMRSMLYDMSSSEGLPELLEVFNPEQLIPMTYDGRLFGLPETQNFFVLYYRKDILDSLSLSVPSTWQDVLNMLPVLRRYGMSFYIPLSNSSALKSFDSTAPLIHQFGGKIYADDGLTAAIDDEKTIEALTFMTDLYREYSMPFQVPSFFNSFRYGDIPIGIGDFGMYLQLTNAASDISGLWDIALVPGMPQEVYNEETMTTETIINRSMGGAQQASIIFEKSDKKEEAWAFLSWWMSTETQVLFFETLVNTLGSRYLWNSANLEAFSQFRMDAAHKAVILEQWTHLKEVPKIPGSYIVEREISNTWNSVVYNDANLRSTVNDAILKIDKELARKMQEFGYIDARGNVIKPFNLPTVEDVEAWKHD